MSKTDLSWFEPVRPMRSTRRSPGLPMMSGRGQRRTRKPSPCRTRSRLSGTTWTDPWDYKPRVDTIGLVSGGGHDGWRTKPDGHPEYGDIGPQI